MKFLAAPIALACSLSFGQPTTLQMGATGLTILSTYKDNFENSIVHLSEDSLVVEESWTEGGNFCYAVNPPICPQPDRFKVRNTYATRNGKITLIRSDSATYTPPQPEKWEFK